MQHYILNSPEHPGATLECFLLTDELSYGQGKKRPAVVVCPGGGYAYCCPREGEPVAMGYACAGYHSFVLRYSVGRSAAGFAPLQDVSWAIGLLRERAEVWNIFPDQIAVCGFSAGGHLALASGLLAQNKPNAMILGYPVSSLPNMPGVDFMLKLLTGRMDVTDADAEPFNLIPRITKDAPPVFLAATAEDVLTSHGTMPIANAYSQLGMPYELHVFQFGPHGYSIATEAAADGSSRQLNEAFAHWQELSILWMKRVFGAPEFTDKHVGQMMKYVKEMGL